MRITRIFFAISLATAAHLMAACAMPYLEGTKFNVHIDGATLPVWVRGNVSSGVAILYLAGAPNCGQMYTAVPAFQELECRYAVLYWDQRFAGSTFGNPSDSTLTMDNFAHDTDAILDTVQSLYRFTSVFLMGHSFGGALGTAYLLDPERQAKIKGWIDIDGGHSYSLANQLVRQNVLGYATTYLANTPNGDDAAYWRNALSFINDNPVVNAGNCVQIQSYLSKLDDFAVSLNESSKIASWVVADMVFSSPIGLEIAQANYLTAVKDWGRDLCGIDYSSQMGAITLPSLVLWGAKDVIFPPAMAQNAYDSLGTPPDDKSVVVFPESGHDPMVSAEAFAATVSGFIDTYK